MRMWMLNPTLFCRQHLLGQHSELHSLLGTLKKKLKVSGYIKSNCLEITAIQWYHNQCVEELLKRNYKHHTPIGNIPDEILEWYSIYLPIKVDQQKSLNLLLSRCSQCKSNYERLLNG